MEEELDLRQYILAIWRWRWLIVGCALLAAVSALVVSLLLPPTYEARAVVVITQLRYQMQFDPRIETVEQWTPAYKAFPTLAKSDEVLQEVLATYIPSRASGNEEWTLRTLGNMVDAGSSDDPSLVVLTVSAGSPEDAAGIANAWARAFAEHANRIYSAGEEDVVAFEAQAARSEEVLEEAEQALIAFQGRNEAAILGNQLDSLQQTQIDYLSEQRRIAYLIQDVAAFRALLTAHPQEETISVADELTALLLQVKAFSAADLLTTKDSTPVELQIGGGASLSGRSLARQIAFLDDLVVALRVASDETDVQLAALEPQILDLQEQLQEIYAEEEELTRARDLAKETYMTLARKLEEAHIAAEEEDGVVRVGSRAATPEVPAGPRKMMNTALGGTVGLMLSVVAVFAIEWWQTEKETEKREPEARRKMSLAAEQ